MNFKYNEKDNLSIKFRYENRLTDIGTTTFGGISTTKTNTNQYIKTNGQLEFNPLKLIAL